MNCTLKLQNHVLMASYISAAHYSTDAQLQATSLGGITGMDTHILHSVNMAYLVNKQHSRPQTTKCFYLAQLYRH
jgi:hypothetical protein